MTPVMRHNYWTALLVALTPFIVTAAETSHPTPQALTLAEAKTIALADNMSMSALLARIDAAQAAVRQVRAITRPQVAVSASAMWLNDVSLAEGDLDGTPYYSTGLSASWLVFDGFATRFRVEAAKAGSDATLAEWNDGRRLLAHGVAIAFLNGLRAQEAGRVSERDAQFNRELLDEAEKRLAAGAGPRVDVLNFKSRVRHAENTLIGAQRDLRAARQALAALLGLPTASLPDNTELVPPDISVTADIPNVTDLISVAQLNRPDLLQQDCIITQLHASLRAARRDRWPTLALSAGYSVERLDNPRFHHDRDASSSVGITASWDVFDGGRRKASIAAATAQLRAAEDARAQALIDVASEIRRAHDNTNTSAEQCRNQAEIANLTNEIREIVRKEYLSGLAPLTRLNEVQTDLVRAEGALAQMRILYAQALEELAATTGRNLPGE